MIRDQARYHQRLCSYHIYIDAFAGAGKHISKKTGAFVLGSPMNALLVEPPFREYHFKVLPKAKYKDYRRALCILDPYGLHLDWKVIYKVGQMKSIDIFLNFPVADINRNVLWRN